MQSYLREFLFLVCRLNFSPVVSKISTKDNDIADFLSRNYTPNDVMWKIDAPLTWHCWDMWQWLFVHCWLVNFQENFWHLLSSAHRTQAFLFSPRTQKNIMSHIRHFVLFCCKFSQTVVPTERDTPVAFFELFLVSASYSHMKNVYLSIKLLHKALNQPFIEEVFQVNTVLQAIKRKIARVPFQVLPITPKILSDMVNFIDPNKVSDLALRCSYLVAFYCFFRSIDNVDPHKEYLAKRSLLLNLMVWFWCTQTGAKLINSWIEMLSFPYWATEIMLWICFFIWVNYLW